MEVNIMAWNFTDMASAEEIIEKIDLVVDWKKHCEKQKEKV